MPCCIDINNSTNSIVSKQLQLEDNSHKTRFPPIHSRIKQ